MKKNEHTYRLLPCTLKFFAAIAAIFLTTAAAAQSSYMRIDTSYVRYEQFDWDAWVMEDSINRSKWYATMPVRGSAQEAILYHDILQYNYTSRPEGVNVAGLSCCAFVEHTNCHPMEPDEFLLLYDASTDTFMFKGQLQWKQTDTAGAPIYNWMTSLPYVCGVEHAQRMENPHLNPSYRIFDYYFDKPIRVFDSFYVGCTSYNARNMYTGETSLPMNMIPCVMTILAPHSFNPLQVDTTCGPPPTPWKIWDHRDAALHSLGWQHYSKQYNYLLVRPIIEVYDTVYEMPPCPLPTGIIARGSYSDTVTIEWNHDSQHHDHLVCWGPSGTLPGEGTIDMVHNDDKWVFTDTAYQDVPMVSYISTLCTEYDTVRKSVWSSPVRWTLHNWNIGIPDDDDLARTTLITPNPASSSALVSAPCRIEKVEAYSAAGTKVLDLTVGAQSASLDLAGWPSGTYVVLIRTASGTATKRLVVQ